MDILTARSAAVKRWSFVSLDTSVNLDEDRIEYSIYGQEVCPICKKQHLHGFVVFKKPCRLTSVKKMDCRAFWVKAKGTIADNIANCTKESGVVIFGHPPNEQYFAGSVARRLQCLEGRAKLNRDEYIKARNRIRQQREDKAKKEQQDNARYFEAARDGRFTDIPIGVRRLYKKNIALIYKKESIKMAKLAGIYEIDYHALTSDEDC